MDLQVLHEHVKARAEDMSPRLRTASTFLLQHPDEVALQSMREVASLAGLAPSTFVRLSRFLGFADYSALRQVFMDDLRRTPPAFSARAAALQARDDEAAAPALVRELFAAKAGNIERTLQRNEPQALVEVAGLIERAARVFVVGQRSCYPIAFFFHYVHRLFASKSLLVQDLGGGFADALRGIGPSDLLLVVSVEPYTRNAVAAARYAAGQGCPIVAVTDGDLSPLAALAERALIVDPASPSFFHSMVSALALVEALLALLMARGGEAALASLKLSEEQLDRFGAYWGAPSARGRA